MKKGLKLGIVALALFAMAGTIYTQTAKAENPSALVKVTIIEGQNNCDDLNDYIWTGITASLTDTQLTGITNPLYCSLLRDSATQITFTLTDLNGTHNIALSPKIAKENFTIVANVGTFTGSLTPDSGYNPNSLVYSAGGTFYDKVIHEVGEFTKDITVSGVVPAGTAVDVYTGELNINVPDVATAP